MSPTLRTISLLIALLCAPIASANEVLPIDLATKTLINATSAEDITNNTSNHLTTYQAVTDILIGRKADSLSDYRDKIDKNLGQFQQTITLYETLMGAPLNVGINLPEYIELKKIAQQTSEDDTFIANLLLSIYHLKRADTPTGLSFIETAIRLTSEMPTTPLTLNYRYDASSVALTGYTLDNNTTQALTTLEALLSLSEITNRKIDGFSIINNIANSYYYGNEIDAAIKFLKTTENFLDKSSEAQRTVYYYSLARYQNEAGLYKEALKSALKSNDINSSESTQHYILMLLTRIYANLNNLAETEKHKALFLKSVDRNPESQTFATAMHKINSQIAKMRGDKDLALFHNEKWSEGIVNSLKSSLSGDRRKANDRILMSQTLSNQELKQYVAEAKLKDEIIAEQKFRAKLYAFGISLLALGSFIMSVLNKRLKRAKIDAVILKEEAEDARDRAKAGERAKEQILAAMSHEFRTPLNAIIPVTEILGNIHNDKQTRSYLSLVRNAGESLLSMIENLYSIANGSESESHFTQDTNIRNELITIAKPWVKQFDDKELSFQIKISKNLPRTYQLERNTLKIILDNLFSNALKFTKAGEVSLLITEIEKNKNTGLKIKLSDTGLGINLANVETYLSPFTQQDMSITRTHGGLGIGLAAINTTVEKYGGNIKFESNIPRGTIVTVTIPASFSEIEHNRSSEAA